MDQQTRTVFSAVKELHSSNKLLFERFNVSLPTIDDKHLACKKGTQTVQAGVKDLTRRITLLEDGKKLHEETIQTLQDQLKVFKENVETLNKALTLGTVVSKPKAETESNTGTTETTCEGCNAITRDAFVGNCEHDRGKLQSNQTLGNTNVQAQESTDGNTCPEMLTTRMPKMVKLNVEWIQDDKAYWRKTWHQSIEQGRLQFRNQDGIHSVICLDISESMSEGNAWSEAIYFLNDYLTGLEEMAALRWLTNEHVALVTFGHETNLQQPFTNNVKDIKRIVSTLRLGGPSALYGGLVLSIAAAAAPEYPIVQGSTLLGSSMRSKIVLITDGFPTENCLKQGPDVADPSKLDETKSSIELLVGQFDGDIVCIPVGQSTNMDFLKLLVETSSGRLLDYKAGKRLSRDYYLRTKLLYGFGEVGVEPFTHGEEVDITEEDKEDMIFIQRRTKALVRPTSIDYSHGERYRESNSKYLPIIGSRVRRGPDWRCDDQDSHGPGIVVGHGQNDDQVWVTWDENEETRTYRYGNGEYDVLIVDEPRKLEPGQKMAAGCIVKPGKDWKDKGKVCNTGVVIEILAHDTAVVRWDNADRNTYTFGRCGFQEIELSSPVMKPFTTADDVMEHDESAHSDVPVTTLPKGKNKNISYKRK